LVSAAGALERLASLPLRRGPAGHVLPSSSCAGRGSRRHRAGAPYLITHLIVARRSSKSTTGQFQAGSAFRAARVQTLAVSTLLTGTGLAARWGTSGQGHVRGRGAWRSVDEERGGQDRNGEGGSPVDDIGLGDGEAGRDSGRRGGAPGQCAGRRSPGGRVEYARPCPRLARERQERRGRAGVRIGSLAQPALETGHRQGESLAAGSERLRIGRGARSRRMEELRPLLPGS
jgi:hypothetical protein